jgi:hypothetical protein
MLMGTRTIMKRKTVALIVCHLFIICTAQFYAAGVQAMPARQGELLDATQPQPVTPAVSEATEHIAPSMISLSMINYDAALSDDSSDSSQTVPDVDDKSCMTIVNNPCLFKSGDEHNPEGNGNSAVYKSLSMQLGQHMDADISNILGEIDGIRVDYRLTGNLMLNGVASYPVKPDQDGVDDAHQVFGLSANTGKIGHAWDLSSYLIEQQDNGGIRRNVGGAVRYQRDKRSLLLLIDYDMASSSLDAFTASGALRLQHSTTLSATVDVRSSPLYKRHQKYLQRTMATTDGWIWNMPMDRITHFTQEMSEEVTTLAVGLSHSFSERLKLTGSAAMLDVSRNSATNDSAATPSEYFYHLQLSGSDMLFRGNSHVLDFSHRITDSMRTSSATIDTRYSINHCWKVSPRLHTDYRDNLQDRSIEWVTAPSIRMEYNWRDQYGVKIEAGGEWVTRELSDQATSDSSYFVSLAYKASY